MRISRSVGFVLAQIALMIVFVVAENALKNRALAFVWMACAFRLAFYEEFTAPREIDDQPEVDEKKAIRPFGLTSLRVVALLTLSVVVSGLIAHVNIDMARHENLDFSLLGVPYYIPIGAFVLAATTVALAGFVARRFMLVGNAEWAILACSASLLTFVWIYAFGYLESGDSSFSQFAGSYISSNPQWPPLGSTNSRDLGQAPSHWLTPVVQAFGFLFGGTIAFFRGR